MARKPLHMGERRKGDPLPTFGDLRKGKPKVEVQGDNGKASFSKMGPELNDFRVCNFNEANPDLMAFIQSIAKLQKEKLQDGGTLEYWTANHLQFVFASPQVSDNLMVFNECYKGGVMIHRSAADGEPIIQRALDPVTFAPIIVDGRHVETGKVVLYNDEPLYSYKNNKGEMVEVTASPVTRMKVMLRGQPTIGTWDVLSSSGIDGEHLKHQLETFYTAFSQHPILKSVGLMGIPFILHRMPPQEVPYYDEAGKRHTGKHSFITIEIDPSFGPLYMESVVRNAIQAVQPLEMLTAPSGPEWIEEGDNDKLLDAASGGNKEAEKVEVVTWPKSGEEYIAWCKLNKYSPKNAQDALGQPATEWVKTNAGGYEQAAKTISAFMAKPA